MRHLKRYYYLLNITTSRESYNGHDYDEHFVKLVETKSKRNLDKRFSKLAQNEYGYRGFVRSVAYTEMTLTSI